MAIRELPLHKLLAVFSRLKWWFGVKTKWTKNIRGPVKKILVALVTQIHVSSFQKKKLHFATLEILALNVVWCKGGIFSSILILPEFWTTFLFCFNVKNCTKLLVCFGFLLEICFKILRLTSTYTLITYTQRFKYNLPPMCLDFVFLCNVLRNLEWMWGLFSNLHHYEPCCGIGSSLWYCFWNSAGMLNMWARWLLLLFVFWLIIN